MAFHALRHVVSVFLGATPGLPSAPRGYKRARLSISPRTSRARNLPKRLNLSKTSKMSRHSTPPKSHHRTRRGENPKHVCGAISPQTRPSGAPPGSPTQRPRRGRRSPSVGSRLLHHKVRTFTGGFCEKLPELLVGVPIGGFPAISRFIREAHVTCPPDAQLNLRCRRLTFTTPPHRPRDRDMDLPQDPGGPPSSNPRYLWCASPSGLPQASQPLTESSSSSPDT